MSETKKAATLFDFIDGLTHKKKPWKSWSESDQSKFSVYMTNRWLSMRMELVELVNELQQYTIGVLRPEETYKMYYELLPNNKTFAKYVKGKSDDKYSAQLVAQIAEHYQVSKSEATEYIDLMTADTCKNIVSLYGYTESEIKTMLKGLKK
jgi:hypothetical protein